MLTYKVVMTFALCSTLVAVCSCGDRPPDGSSAASTAFPSRSPAAKTPAGRSEQAVLMHLKLTGNEFGAEPERRRIASLEDELAQAITAAGVGEYDGNEIGGGEYVLYAYGPDGRQLADVVRPIIVKAAASGSFMITRAGPPGAPELREELSGSAGPGSPTPPAPAPSATHTPGVPGRTGGADIVIPKGFDAALLEILACPEDKTPVRLAGRRELDEINAKIREGGLRQRDGSTRTKPVEALLIRQDGKVGYEIENGVPVMLIERAIVLWPEMSERSR